SNFLGSNSRPENDRPSRRWRACGDSKRFAAFLAPDIFPLQGVAEQIGRLAVGTGDLDSHDGFTRIVAEPIWEILQAQFEWNQPKNEGLEGWLANCEPEFSGWRIGPQSWTSGGNVRPVHASSES